MLLYTQLVAYQSLADLQLMERFTDVDLAGIIRKAEEKVEEKFKLVMEGDWQEIKEKKPIYEAAEQTLRTYLELETGFTKQGDVYVRKSLGELEAHSRSLMQSKTTEKRLFDIEDIEAKILHPSMTELTNGVAIPELYLLAK